MRPPHEGAARDQKLDDREVSKPVSSGSAPSPQFRQLSPIELAAIFAPPGTVPAVIRHKGKFIIYHCPPDIAANVKTEGEA